MRTSARGLGWLGKARSAGRIAADDSGLALLTVVGVAMIVFILCMAVLTLVTYQTTAAGQQESRTKALHTADAGINAYLYELRRNDHYYSSNPTLGPVTLSDGSWVVTATPPTTTTPLILRAVGTIPGRKASRTVVASVRFPTFADYMFLTDATINIGADATIEGKVRANGAITNAGHITGSAISGDRVTNTGQIDSGYKQFQPTVDFGGVVSDLTAIRAAAQAAGTYFGTASGATGYRAMFSPSGTSIIVDKVNANSSGITVVSNVGTFAVPSSGAFYFDDEVWVAGAYDAMCTIGCSTNIYIPGNITLRNANDPFTLGLISDTSVIVKYGYTGFPTDCTIQACMVARQGSVKADLDTYPNTLRHSITIKGSMAYRQFGGFALVSGGRDVAGFDERTYSYDQRADTNPPPMFPVVRDGTLKVATWIDQ